MRAEPEKLMIIGVDLGQTNDYTAICIVEKASREGEMVREEYPGEPPRWVREAITDEYHVRHLERPALGTPYPEIVERVLALVRKLGGRIILAVDQTGVGRPVVDMIESGLWAAVEEAEAKTVLTPAWITISGGDSVTPAADGGLKVPKRDLVSAALVLLQNGQLKIASSLPLREALVRELQNFRVKINLATGRDSYGAGRDWRENEHDDLVLSVAMACWAGEQYSPPRPLVRLG